jgi:hypothetical protein
MELVNIVCSLKNNSKTLFNPLEAKLVLCKKGVSIVDGGM